MRLRQNTDSRQVGTQYYLVAKRRTLLLLVSFIFHLRCLNFCPPRVCLAFQEEQNWPEAGKDSTFNVFANSKGSKCFTSWIDIPVFLPTGLAPGKQIFFQSCTVAHNIRQELALNVVHSLFSRTRPTSVVNGQVREFMYHLNQGLVAICGDNQEEAHAGRLFALPGACGHSWLLP